MRRAAVLGHPIAHSLSPVLHLAAYAALGLDDWEYDRADVTEDGLADFVAGCGPEWAGLSLTMPLKVAVMPLATSRSSIVERTGVGNTLVFGADGRRHVDNTDVQGVVDALASAHVTRVEHGVVLGGGATARSAVAALADMGAGRVSVAVRRAGASAGLEGIAPGVELDEVDLASVPLQADVVVSTIPAEATTAVIAGLPAAVHPVLLDAIYAPWPTPLAAAWAAADGVVVRGHEMLLAQAVPQVALMTGREVGDDVRERMRAALLQALD